MTIQRISRHIVEVLVCLAIAACSPSYSSGDISLASLDIADPVLQACISAAGNRNQWSLSGQVTHLECTNPQADKIRTLDGIEALINLQSLDLSHNAISDPVALNELHHLTELDLGYNEIELVGLSRLHESLETLILDSNEIYDITWLATFERMKHLSLSHNQLRLIPAIVGLDSIRSLDLSYNDIIDVTPLKSLPQVSLVNIKNNPLDCATIDMLVRDIPSRIEIVSDCEGRHSIVPND